MGVLSATTGVSQHATLNLRKTSLEPAASAALLVSMLVEAKQVREVSTHTRTVEAEPAPFEETSFFIDAMTEGESRSPYRPRVIDRIDLSLVSDEATRDLYAALIANLSAEDRRAVELIEAKPCNGVGEGFAARQQSTVVSMNLDGACHSRLYQAIAKCLQVGGTTPEAALPCRREQAQEEVRDPDGSDWS